MGVTRKFLRFCRRHAPTRRSAFTAIYKLNDWNAPDQRDAPDSSVSGPGSTLDATYALRQALPALIESLGVRTILDAPCGDCRWMPLVDLKGADYTGIDIVKPLIESNAQRLSAADFTNAGSVKFQTLDLVEDELPKVDLIICRDCLVHLRHKDVERVLENARRSGSKYLLTTTYPDAPENTDLKRTGGWRALDLTLPPFNLPAPEQMIREHRESGAPESEKPIENAKFMGLWRLN